MVNSRTKSRSRSRSRSAYSKSREEERQPEGDLIDPNKFEKVNTFDYSNYLQTHKMIPVDDHERPIREEKRSYANIEQDMDANSWDYAPLYKVPKYPSEKSPSKKRTRYVSTKRRGKERHGKERHEKGQGGSRKSSKSIRRNTKKPTRR